MYTKILLLIIATSSFLAAEKIPVGLTAKGFVIEADKIDSDSRHAKTVLLIGGLEDQSANDFIRKEVDAYAAIPASHRKFKLLAIPSANPEKNPLVFPPVGAAYREGSEAHYLWRWIGLHAPDVVLIVGKDSGDLGKAISANAVAGIGSSRTCTKGNSEKSEED